jgi:hypothetical protein
MAWSEALLEAVRGARRLRGTVMLAVEGEDAQWCAACAAVDETVELRVGEPPRRGLVRRHAPGEQWLRDHAWTQVFDAWALPGPALGDEGCAATLAAALEQALGADPARPLRHVLTHPGVMEGDQPPAPDAPAAEHIEVALRALTSGSVRIECGSPSALWAIVWARDGELLVEQETPERTWTEPRTADGARAAAEALAQPSTPLYLSFIP